MKRLLSQQNDLDLVVLERAFGEDSSCLETKGETRFSSEAGFGFVIPAKPGFQKKLPDSVSSTE